MQVKTKLNWKIDQSEIEYAQAESFMEAHVEKMIDQKADQLIWFLQHPPVITAGTSAKEADLLDPEKFPVHNVGRGGQYTYHGPGQQVIYVMLNLDNYGNDIRKFIWTLEEVVIQTLQKWDIKGERRQDRIGIWVQTSETSEDKIAAIGVRVRKWVSFHGIAININPDLSHFNSIVPCGIVSPKAYKYGVTSFEKLGVQATAEELQSELKRQFIKFFEKDTK